MASIYAHPIALTTVLKEEAAPFVLKSEAAPKIALPSSPSKRGNAFEHLILSYYNSVRSLEVKEWSSCLYGDSGTLYQCDGILWDGANRYLLEAKFFEKRAATLSDLHIERRLQAARDLGCKGIVCVSLNGFDESVHEWQREETSLEILLIDWGALRPHVLSRIAPGEKYTSVLLDAFRIEGNCIISGTGKYQSCLQLDSQPQFEPLVGFPEFICFSNELEKWLRRLPRLRLAQTQFGTGHFCFLQETQEARYIADRQSELSLWEVWQVEDTFLGYSARVYKAMKITAAAVSAYPNRTRRILRRWLEEREWHTGDTGVRKALDNLTILGLVEKQPVGRRVTYALTPLGKIYVNAGADAELIFHEQLRRWPPYRALCEAIEKNRVEPKQASIVSYFKAQYAPYEPYARSLFNDNTADGLLSLYREFEINRNNAEGTP